MAATQSGTPNLQSGVNSGGSDTIRWSEVIGKLIGLIDTPGDTYYSGPRLFRVIEQFDRDLPYYGDFLERRAVNGQSMERSCYFRDLFMNLQEADRIKAVSTIIDVVEIVKGSSTPATSEIRNLLGRKLQTRSRNHRRSKISSPQPAQAKRWI